MNMHLKSPAEEREFSLTLDALHKAIHEDHSSVESCGSCRKVHGGSCKIPDAPLYVLSNDGFLSGWGKSAGAINVCVVPCASMDEVNEVIRYIESRSDQKYIRYTINKPRERGRLLSLLTSWRKCALEGFRFGKNGERLQVVA